MLKIKTPESRKVRITRPHFIEQPGPWKNVDLGNGRGEPRLSLPLHCAVLIMRQRRHFLYLHSGVLILAVKAKPLPRCAGFRYCGNMYTSEHKS